MPIEYEGLSDQTSVSIAGHLRLGEEMVEGREHPEKIDYFRVDPKDELLLPVLKQILGEKPKRIRIMFLSGDFDLIAPQFLMKFGAGPKKAGVRHKDRKSSLMCKGTGGVGPDGNPKPAIFRLVDPKTGEVDVNHPCAPESCPDFQSGRCRRVAFLTGFILCDFPTLRTWQINTSGKGSIRNMNSRLRELANLVQAAGKNSIAGIPLILSVKPQQSRRYDKKTGKRMEGWWSYYVVDLDLDTEALMRPGPTVAFLSKIASSGRLTPAPAETDIAPEGLFPRSQIEEGADPAAERRQIAEDAGEAEDVTDDEQTQDPAPPSGAGETAGGVAADASPVGLPDDVVFGCRALGLTKKQVKALVTRYAGEGGVLTVKAKDELVSYLSGLVDLKESGDTASLQANIAALDLPSEDPNPAPAKAAAVKKSAAALGLKGLDV